MKINKKINYSRIAVSYLFLGTLAIFIGLGAGTCLANTVDVNSSSELEKAIGSNISTINIKADSITLGQKLPVINRSLVIYGKTNGSILDGNNAHKILEFSQNLNNITINNTHFQRGHNEDPLDEYSGGGAAHIKKGKTILFNNTNFSNNTAVSQGGAILSLGDNSRKNSLLFNGRTTFTSNESTSGAGGAMAVWNSDLTFGGEVEFTNNKSIVGGAIYSLGDGPHKNIILFKGKTTFTGNKSIDNESIKGYGGAMFIENSDLTFGGEAEFENNKSNKDGGAIFSKGDAQNKNTLLFNGKATFNGNKSTSDRGGAIFAQDSDLTFDGKTKFENNTSKESGGAIFSMGNAQNKNILLFSREAIFTGNKSTGGYGGAIFAQDSDLTFDRETKFTRNTSKNNGGAIFSMGYGDNKNTLRFNDKAIFADNKSVYGYGGAIDAFYSNLHFDRETKFEDNKSNGGGAIYMQHSDLVFVEEANFVKNISKNNGGAIYFLGNTQNENVFSFNGKVTFTENKSINNHGGDTNSHGGAIYAERLAIMIFVEEVNFVKNISKNNGGAIYSLGDAHRGSTIIFNNKTTFADNVSTDGEGGAIYANFSNLTFGGEANFVKNNSKNKGGAIYFQGDGNGKSILLFNGRTTFADNESTEGSGGAIYAKYSDLTFGGEVEFKNNSSCGGGSAIMLYSLGGINSTVIFEKAAIFSGNISAHDGGTIQIWGNAQNKNTLEFRGKTVFTANGSIGGHGGVIDAWNSDLTFGEEAEFTNNSSFYAGGAILVNSSCRDNAVDITFNGLATFRNNSSAKGGAIHLHGSANMTFNSGLSLINNSTERSGAIHMDGEDNGRIARVTIVQKNLDKPTEFRGNISNNGQGHSAFYLEKYAELNFTAEVGNIDLHDAIVGGYRNQHTNAVTVAVAINNGAGWFNVKQGGSIANVNLTNRGNLNLAESQTAARPLNFRNSGKIIFGIFPENNRCSGIQAEDITLEEGTTLEIAAAEGTYTAGNSYDIMVSGNTIKKPENINITLPQTLPRGLRAKAEFQDKFYRLLIVKDSEDIEDNDESYCD